MAIAFSLTNIFSFVVIIVLYSIDSESLTAANIFAMLEVFIYFRNCLFSFIFGLGTIQDVIIILKRYAEVLNVKAEKMVKIESSDNDALLSEQIILTHNL